MGVPTEKTAAGEAVAASADVAEAKAVPVEKTRPVSPPSSAAAGPAEDDEHGNSLPSIPWQYKWIALVCVVCVSLFSKIPFSPPLRVSTRYFPLVVFDNAAT